MINAEKEKSNRLQTTFHRTFPLKRQPVSSICNFAANSKEKLTKANLIKHVGLGTIYAEAYPRYCRASGLIKTQGDKLTHFGQLVTRFDSTLSDSQTIWLMHFHMSATMGPGPEFWSELVRSFFIPGNLFTTDDINEIIATSYWNKTGQMLATNGISSSGSIFLTSYTDTDCLGGLNLISKVTDNTFMVNQPYFHNNMIIAYALCHFWEQMYPGNISVTLDSLLQSDLPKLFLLSASDFEGILDELKAIGFIDIHRTAQPYQIFLKKGGDFALNQIYGSE